jgi:hypothetical protein
LILIGDLVEDVGRLILFPFRNSAKLKLVVVMVFYPVLFTTLQFLITDSFIKYNNTNTACEEATQCNGDHREDDDEANQKYNI